MTLLPMCRMLLTCLLVTTAGCVRPPTPTADTPLAKALEKGPAVVIVTLDTPRIEPGVPVDFEVRQREIDRLQDRVLAAVEPEHFQLIHRYELAGGLAAKITTQGLVVLEARPEVVAIELDRTGSGALDSSVSQISANQWASVGQDGDGVIVAALDSGLAAHPDLSDDVVYEACLLEAQTAAGGVPCPDGSGQQLDEDGAALDGEGHGTNVTGVLTSGGSLAPPGVAPGANIAAIKVLDDNDDFSSADLIAGLDHIITLIIANALDVRVVNISLGLLVPAGECNVNLGEQTGDAVAMLEQLGVLVVAASGNDSERTRVTFPGCVDGVFTVAAVDDDNNLAGFSNISPAVDVLAPGVDITSTGDTQSGFQTTSGTSLATPHVAACAALRIADDPTLTPADLKTILSLSSTFVTEPETGLSFPRLFCGLPQVI